jgi:large subunit ribosomal protein L25
LLTPAVSITGIQEQHIMAKTKAHAPNNLTVAVRTETGKGASRRARREGKVPAVLYGHGTDPQHLELPARELAAVLRNFGTNAVLTLDIEGTEALALPKQLEIHPIRRNIQHVDLIVVRRGEKVTVEVNVLVEGDATPGALVTQEANAVEIESDAMSIPESLTVSVEGAAEGTQITAGEIELPSGVTLVSDPETLVVNIVAAPSAEELEAEGGGASLEEQAAEVAEADASEAGDSESAEESAE